jgi:hypothetical protein
MLLILDMSNTGSMLVILYLPDGDA